MFSNEVPQSSQTIWQNPWLFFNTFLSHYSLLSWKFFLPINAFSLGSGIWFECHFSLFYRLSWLSCIHASLFSSHNPCNTDYRSVFGQQKYSKLGPFDLNRLGSDKGPILLLGNREGLIKVYFCLWMFLEDVNLLCFWFRGVWAVLFRRFISGSLYCFLCLNLDNEFRELIFEVYFFNAID